MHTKFRSKSQSIQNCRGSAFVQVLILSAVAAAFMAFAESYFNTQQRLVTQSGLKMASLDLQQSVAQLLSVSSQCTQNLAGLDISEKTNIPVPAIEYYNSDGKIITGAGFQTGLEVKGGSKIGNLSLDSIAAKGTNVYQADMKIGLEAPQSASFSLQPVYVRGLSIVTDSTGKIKNCVLPLPQLQNLAIACPSGTFLSGFQNGQGQCTSPSAPNNLPVQANNCTSKSAPTNSSTVNQSGTNNAACVTQLGTNNTSNINQNGNNNVASTYQNGTNNNLNINQAGDNNSGLVVQAGSHSSANLNQSSSGSGQNSATIVQIGVVK